MARLFAGHRALCAARSVLDRGEHGARLGQVGHLAAGCRKGLLPTPNSEEPAALIRRTPADHRKLRPILRLSGAPQAASRRRAIPPQSAPRCAASCESSGRPMPPHARVPTGASRESRTKHARFRRPAAPRWGEMVPRELGREAWGQADPAGDTRRRSGNASLPRNPAIGRTPRRGCRSPGSGGMAAPQSPIQHRDHREAGGTRAGFRGWRLRSLWLRRGWNAGRCARRCILLRDLIVLCDLCARN